MSSVLDEMMSVATEELIDPTVGKYEDAALMGVTHAGTPDNPYLTLTWGNLVSQDGTAFTHTDRLFPIREDTHPIGKSRFMQKLKALGVVPADFKKVLYFTSESLEGLEMALMDLVGQQWPITISKDNRDFYVTTVRKRPKQH